MLSQKPAISLTVDRIYDEPNLSGVSISSIGWRPDGRLVSYLRGKGNRNEIWGFDVLSGRRERLFSYTRLAGPGRRHRGPIHKRHPTHRRDWRQRRIRSAETLTYLWAPRGDMLLVAAPFGAPSVLDLKTDRLYPLTHDAQPVYDIHWSPNGRFVSFVRPFDLFLIDTMTGRELPVTYGSSEPLRSATPDSMGDLLCDAGHWWSPDSQRIAYLQTDERAVDLFAFPDLQSSSGASQWERYPRPGRPNPVIALKVASAQGHIWIDTRAWPGRYLARVAWLPDSRHLALQMLNREQTELSLVLADALTGATRPILTEKDATWVNVSDDLRFFADGRRFLWTSEKDSYRHLYIHETDGGRQLAQLTAGPEASVAVEGLDERHGAAYYLVFPEPHTEGRLKRVNFKLGANGCEVGDARELTTAPGTHFAHLSPDYQYFADNWSSALHPPRLNLHGADGRYLATIEENRCDELTRFRLGGFEFRAIPAAKIGDPSDGMPLYSKLLAPTPLERGRRYPVIVYVYGGPLPDGFGLARNVLNYWRPVPELWMQMMAQRGFGVFSLDNRGSNAAPRGHAWEAPIHQRLGEVELADQLEGVKYLRSLEWVDADRIGILGGSFGGFMSLNAMLHAPGTFKAGIAFAPVTNWSEYDSVYTERYMNLPSQNLEGYRKTALPRHAADLAGSLLLLHGTGDDNVHLQHSIQLINALLQAGKDFEMMLYPGQDHMSFFGMGQDPARLWARITAFFMKNL